MDLKTRRATLIALLFITVPVLALFSAEYKGRIVDGLHFPAVVHIEGDSNSYEVDVVFVARAANLAFPDAINPFFRSTLVNGRYLTLYLLEETIEDPGEIRVKQVSSPTDIDPRAGSGDPADWPATRFWIMKVRMH